MIEEYKDKHKDERAFVVCNGPSLNKHDLSKLKSEITFGMSRIYLQDKFIPKYYTTEDWQEIVQFYKDINDYSGPDRKFVAKRFASDYIKGDDVTYIKFRRWRQNDFNFVNKNIGIFFWGATVTYLAIQLAYYMGCNPIYIIGADHTFGKDGKDHFIEGYLDESDEYSFPDVELMNKSYRYARDYLKSHNVIIRNATIGGELDIFERADYESLF